MYLTKAELIRVLEYIPKETAADLHVKFVGQIVSTRFFEEVVCKSTRTCCEREAAELNFIQSLSDYEMEAWQKYTDSLRAMEEELTV